jgi:hypothetical protein
MENMKWSTKFIAAILQKTATLADNMKKKI